MRECVHIYRYNTKMNFKVLITVASARFNPSNTVLCLASFHGIMRRLPQSTQQCKVEVSGNPFFTHLLLIHSLTWLNCCFLHEIIICCMTHHCIDIFLFMTGSSAWLSSASGSSSNVPTIISAQSSGTESNQSISALDTPKIGQHYQCYMNRVYDNLELSSLITYWSMRE